MYEQKTTPKGVVFCCLKNFKKNRKYSTITIMKKISAVGICTAVFFGMLPFVYTSRLFHGSENAKFFAMIGVVTLLGLYFAIQLFREKVQISVKGRWLLLSTFGVFVAYYISSFVGVLPEHSFFSDIQRSTGVFYVSYIFLGACILSELLSRNDWVLIRRAIAFSVAVYSLLLWFGPEGFGTTGTFFSINFETSALTLGNTTYAGVYVLLAVAITLIELLQVSYRSRLWWALLGTIAVTLTSPLMFSLNKVFSLGSPVTWVGEARASSVSAFILLLSTLGALWLYRKTSMRAVVVWTVGWVVIMAVPLALLFLPGSAVQDIYSRESTPARIIVWESSYAAIAERPFFGWGPENFRFAHERYFDYGRIVEAGVGELWFDRAHNFFIDTLVSVGIVGLLMIGVGIAFVVRVAIHTYRKEEIYFAEGYVLAILPFIHILQLQTGFDTVASFALLGVIGGYLLWLEKQTTQGEIVSGLWQKVGAGILVGTLFIGGWFVFVREFQSQQALIATFRPKTAEQQKESLQQVVNGPLDFEILRVSSASLIKGVIEQLSGSDTANAQVIMSRGVEQMVIYEGAYEKYLKQAPNDYRAHINYVYLLMMESVLGGENKLEQAKEILVTAYTLAPQSPTTYVVDAVAHLYSGDIEKAQAIITEARVRYPEAEFIVETERRIKEQVETFPTVSLIPLSNL